ncbi:PSD1 and planctomycete cytochrome C domain-containing protein [Luteolibacter sp. GHJ8]|uniref:PSD1 and planctomycete cytochrome C domain-containing protein n=1 Tax=Luteolibacter rhizosphaerae TaxID=2989719 RepID=A0ABT3FX08_9BACT|nr:PSD1 and planctomycete cytochrome C domain-containing protein [Luteolibacter rhizosphaerae]MCW1912093.1 PSD1 and planctomycete cytochrome C domain-containing protein [Luteolibacter rhizosphaerae]
MPCRIHTRGLAVLVTVALARAAEPAPDFNREIRPILSDRCFACHGFDAKAREAELRLDTPEGAFKDKAIVPGNPDESLAWQRIVSTDPDEVMPPADSHLKLSAEEKALLKRWIESGATYQPHWAFMRVERPALPPGDAHPIDALVLKRLAKEGLELAPEATKETLIRRLSLDLRGLPPSPQETEAFLIDTAPEAYERLVDRFLGDPAYGERMAWPWLDAARYADSNGYQGDADRTMWPWRDWVVSAFNRNLSFDQFTLWQIAGDLLPDATPEQVLATGFLRNYPINGEGGRIPEENRVDYVMDMAETTGTVWMGLTMNCCRCHDHKYDPLTQRDYYSLYAFFNQTPVDGSGGDPQTAPVIAVPAGDQKAREEQLVRQRSDLDQQLAERAKQLEADQAAWEVARLAQITPQIWQTLPPDKISGAEAEMLEDRSILTAGPNPVNATYTVRATLPEGPLAAIKLEALRHPSMTQGGIARSDSGNFVLTGFEATLVTAQGESQRLTIPRAEATYEQGGVFRVSGALDEDPASGWAVFEGRPVDRDHAAVFHLAEPVEIAPGSSIEITLRHDSPHAHHNLGRFRLAISSESSATLAEPDQSALLEVLKLPGANRTAAQAKLVSESHRAADPEHSRLSRERGDTETQLVALRKAMPQVMVMGDREALRPTHVLAVGSYDKPLEEVSAATPPILPPLVKSGGHANRLDLAKWLVSRDHPLTARVTVNRYWQELFGIGLIKTPEDFGVQSEVPLHPELLDWLAAEFMESGWDTKQLLRAIVTSRVYRQSSRVTPKLLEKDPANRLLARGPRFRMPAWMLRDQALAAGGIIVGQAGGPPVKPYSPENLWPDATFGKVQYVRDKGEALHRRSLYTFWRRISMPPMFFDNAKREVCTVNPSRTNTPLHALSTLNDVTYVEAARFLAERAAKEAGTGDAALSRAFEIALGRKPDPEELAILSESLRQAKDHFSMDPQSATDFLTNGDHSSATSLEPVERAALASVCLSILNLDETLTKE